MSTGYYQKNKERLQNKFIKSFTIFWKRNFFQLFISLISSSNVKKYER